MPSFTSWCWEKSPCKHVTTIFRRRVFKKDKRGYSGRDTWFVTLEEDENKIPILTISLDGLKKDAITIPLPTALP